MNQCSGLLTKMLYIAEDIVDARVLCPPIASIAQPGQFVSVRCGEHPLRRPISVCSTDGDTLRLVFQVVGEGTRWLSRLRPEDMLDLLGPLGNGFDLRLSSRPAVFVGGGIGVPPLLYAAGRYAAPATALLGFRSQKQVILREDFERIGVHALIATDDGSAGAHGPVTLLLREHLDRNDCGAVFACGPRPMLRAVAELAREYGVPCQVSMEERMACGVGACLGCAVRVRENGAEKYRHVCKDGPVFDANAIVW